MSEEKSSPVGIIVVVAVMVGVMIGCSGMKNNPIAEAEPNEKKLKPDLRINMASTGNKRILSYLSERLKKPSAELTDGDYAAVKSISIHHSGNLDDISLISKCVNLQQLDLMNGGVLEDIKPLANLTKLESVGLWGNKVSDLSPLSKLINIKYLNLTYCPVTDITPLAGLKNLKRVEGLKKEVADELRKVLPNCEVK